MFWFSVNVLSEIFFILRSQRDIFISLHTFSCKVPVVLSDFSEIEFPRKLFRKISQYKISWKSVQWEASCCMRYLRKALLTLWLTVKWRLYCYSEHGQATKWSTGLLPLLRLFRYEYYILQCKEYNWYPYMTSKQDPPIN